MAKNADKIISRYGDGSREENRSSGSRADYTMEYKYTKRILNRYVTKDSSVLEIGCGTGYYGVYLADKCKNYAGVDISPGNIEVFSRKISTLSLTDVTASVGDATDLSALADESFDIVLVLGPMYHLPPEERDLVFAESRRVCRSGGVLMFAYINKIGVYIGSCISKPELYPNVRKNRSLLRDGIDDTRDSIYWFTAPEEIEAAAKQFDLQILENLGVDFNFAPGMLDKDAENASAWEELIDFMAASKSCAGLANHALLVCRK